MRREIIVVGTSLGGLSALGAMLANLPAGFAVPLAIVQHRSVESNGMLIRELRRHIGMRLREPSDKEPILPGFIYLAPADYHLLVEPGEFRLSIEGPVNHARPSIDVLFESAADAYGDRTLGVVLTGANEDGAWGSACIKRVGGAIVVQDPRDAECAIMPKAALKATPVDAVLSLAQIRAYLIDVDSDSSQEAIQWKPL